MIAIQTDGFCAVCGKDKKLFNHHLAWTPEEVTIPVCGACHQRIHKGNLEFYRPKDEPPIDERQEVYTTNFKERNPHRWSRIYQKRWKQTHPELVKAQRQRHYQRMKGGR